MGISPSSSIKIIERYDQKEIEWFIGELKKNSKEDQLVHKIENANEAVMVQSVGTKKGNLAYVSWRRNIIQELEDIRRVKTVFEKLRDKESDTTVFGKLKTMSRS